MTPPSDLELSALLDGELPAARAATVRAAIGADPALTARLAALDRLDARLRDAARDDAFEPRASLRFAEAPAPLARATMAAIVAALVVVRLLAKVDGLAAAGVLLQLLAGVALLLLVSRLARDDAPAALA